MCHRCCTDKPSAKWGRKMKAGVSLYQCWRVFQSCGLGTRLLLWVWEVCCGSAVVAGLPLPDIHVQPSRPLHQLHGSALPHFFFFNVALAAVKWLWSSLTLTFWTVSFSQWALVTARYFHLCQVPTIFTGSNPCWLLGCFRPDFFFFSLLWHFYPVFFIFSSIFPSPYSFQ